MQQFPLMEMHSMISSAKRQPFFFGPLYVIHRIFLLILLSSNVAKSHSLLTSVYVIQSFWNFAQSTTVSLPCSVLKFQDDWIIETDNIYEWDFARFEFKVCFGQISYIRQHPEVLTLLVDWVPCPFAIRVGASRCATCPIKDTCNKTTILNI